MNDDHKKTGQSDKSLPLPDDASSSNPAANIIRHRVEAAYQHAPDVKQELQELSEPLPPGKLSRHQRFIIELTSSGKSLPEIQTLWHEYYAGLPDKDKHQVWHEFYAAQEEEHETPTKPSGRASHRRPEPLARSQKPRRYKPPQHVRSLIFGLSTGCLVILIFMFSFFNERFIAPFIQPSRTATNTPIISDSTSVGPNPEIIIPKINVQIPVVYGVNTIDPTTVETALENGVVHYADTADPGQDGNVVIVGHSSNNILNPGNYKFAFVLLDRMAVGDTFYLDKNGVRYTYQIFQREIVGPTDVSVLGPTTKLATASLITCDPPGTSENRLVVIGEQISPDPNANLAASTTNDLATKAAIIPGNSPTLWSRLVNFLEH